MRLVHSFSPFEEICVLSGADGAPVTVTVWRQNDPAVGSICLARVVKSAAAGVFVDIGDGRTAFLNRTPFFIKPDGSVSPTKPAEGDLLLVELCRPAAEDKDPEVRAHVSLSAETVVLLPAQQGNSYARSFSSQTINRFRELFPDMSVMFRTAAPFDTVENISKQITALKNRWAEILKNVPEKPQTIWRPERDVLRLAARYADDLDEIVTDDPETAAVLKERGFADVAFAVSGVWERENVAESLDAALAQKSPLPCGGFLITQQTAACVCFDVNTGAADAFAANQEACPEILRQIRLKGLGGQMIIDFAGRKDKKMLFNLMSRLKSDDVYVAGFSQLGLVELTVEKKRKSVFDDLTDNRQTADIIRTLWFSTPVSDVEIRAPQSVLNGVRPYLNRLETRLKTRIALIPAETAGLKGLKQ